MLSTSCCHTSPSKWALNRNLHHNCPSSLIIFTYVNQHHTDIWSNGFRKYICKGIHCSKIKSNVNKGSTNKIIIFFLQKALYCKTEFFCCYIFTSKILDTPSCSVAVQLVVQRPSKVAQLLSRVAELPFMVAHLPSRIGKLPFGVFFTCHLGFF